MPGPPTPAMGLAIREGDQTGALVKSLLLWMRWLLRACYWPSRQGLLFKWSLGLHRQNGTQLFAGQRACI